MQDAVPPALAKHFDKIVRRVGLYRGPVIEDYRGMMRTVMESQVAAYYDPDTGRVYLLDEGGDALEQGVIYSHELYHALQDQYFDLNGYVSDKLKLDADQTLARVAVVEGEATYICMVWGIRQMTNGTTPPPRAGRAGHRGAGRAWMLPACARWWANRPRARRRRWTRSRRSSSRRWWATT